jgi:diguanylate cyclase (GGDEF)-like protein/PAS domain S-box-containing protein
VRSQPASEEHARLEDLIAAQDRLRRQLEFTRIITKSLGEGVLALNSAGRSIFLNPAGEAMLGWKGAELLGKVVHDLIHRSAADGSPVSRSECLICARSRSGETSYSEDDVFTRRDGSVFPVAYTSSPIFDGDRVTGAVVAFRDLTEQKQAEADRALLLSLERRARAETEAANERLRALIQASPLPISTLDLDGNVVTWNPAAEHTFGWSSDEVIGKAEAIPDDNRASWTAALQLAARGEQVTGAEIRRANKEGEPLDLITSIAPLRDGDGQVTGFVTISTDITGRKRAEQALTHQAMHDALTGLPNRLLLQDRLEQATRAAQREMEGFALLFLDLDGFKSVNDTYGHHTGDLLLQHVAIRIRSALRGSDTVARLGGDEFAVLLLNSGIQGAVLTAEKIIASLGRPIEVDGKQLRIGASCGISLFPDHSDNVSGLIQQADAAMYAAKRGSLGVSVHAPGVEVEREMVG